MVWIKGVWLMFRASRPLQLVALILALGALALTVRSCDRQRIERHVQADRDAAALEGAQRGLNAAESATLNQMERHDAFERSQGNLAGAAGIDDYFDRLWREQEAARRATAAGR